MSEDRHGLAKLLKELADFHDGLHVQQTHNAGNLIDEAAAAAYSLQAKLDRCNFEDAVHDIMQIAVVTDYLPESMFQCDTSKCKEIVLGNCVGCPTIVTGDLKNKADVTEHNYPREIIELVTLMVKEAAEKCNCDKPTF